MSAGKGGKSLKEQNRTNLVLVLMVNVAVAAFVFSNKTLPTSLKQAFDLLMAAIPAGLGGVAFAVANELLSPGVKARIVFWRWTDPLPGSQAFTRYGPADVRAIDVAAIERKLGSSPRVPADQNKAWYALYKTVADQPPVVDAHKSSLLLRDYASMAAMMAVGMPLIAMVIGRGSKAFVVYAAALVVQYLVVRWAASNAGCRFVTNAMACYLDPAPTRA